MISVTFKNISSDQEYAINQISEQLGFQNCRTGIVVDVEMTGKGISISKSENGWKICYGKKHNFMRAISILIENFKQEIGFIYQELPAYESLGVMIDCSRNAVITVDAFKRVVRILSLMGYSTIQMYTEDTFEIDAYKYFGYMRGRYTKQELKECDEYSNKFGIELVPCIQTLAHLEYILKWKEFMDIHDCNDILLVGEDKTYKLIDEMFKTMSESMKSRNINIGMDEAPMLGLGKYLDKHGFQNRFKVMTDHLKRVVEIAHKYGYKPMMWSDTFFRLANDGEYYAKNKEIPQDVIAQIPEDVTLVYWDYYGEDVERYTSMMESHLKFNRKIIFAGGAWKWHGFTPGNEFSIHIAKMAQQACRKTGIRNVLLTAWGDNGAECSFFSILPTLLYWSEACYSHNLDNNVLSRRFRTCVNGDMEDFMKLDMPLLTPDNPSPGMVSVNPPKYLLYQDILCGLFDYNVLEDVYSSHFIQTAKVLGHCAQKNPEWAFLFDTQRMLCHLLELKADAGIKIRKAYISKDNQILKHYSEELLPEILIRIEDFQRTFSKQWMAENKIFGLDCFDIRIGGLKERIRVTIERLLQYLNGVYCSIPELDEERLSMEVSRFNGTHHFAFNKWIDIATPSCMTGL